MKKLALLLILVIFLAGCRGPAAPAPTATVLAAPLPTKTAVPQGGATATPTKTAAPTPAAGLKTTPLGALTLAEYRVVDEATDTPNHFEYSQRIPAEALAPRAALRDWDNTLHTRINQASAAIEPYGWRIIIPPPPPGGAEDVTLVEGGLVAMHLSNLWPISVSGDGSNFVLVVEQRGKGDLFLLTRSSGKLTLTAWDSSLHANTRPVYAGSRLITLERGARPGETLVKQGDAVAYTYTQPSPTVEEPVKGLWSYDGAWVLEVAGQLVIDGKNMNAQLGCDEIFGWQLLKGKPFFFFLKNGKVGLSYDGSPLAFAGYDEVIHYKCCEPAAFNNAGNDQAAWFHARRDGWWFYVEVY